MEVRSSFVSFSSALLALRSSRRLALPPTPSSTERSATGCASQVASIESHWLHECLAKASYCACKTCGRVFSKEKFGSHSDCIRKSGRILWVRYRLGSCVRRSLRLAQRRAALCAAPRLLSAALCVSRPLRLLRASRRARGDALAIALNAHLPFKPAPELEALWRRQFCACSRRPYRGGALLSPANPSAARRHGGRRVAGNRGV